MTTKLEVEVQHRVYNGSNPPREYDVVVWLSPSGIPIPIQCSDHSRALKEYFLSFCKGGSQKNKEAF